MENTTLSIFVPCFNEEKNITKSLNNIKEAVQNIPYEMLVTDDGSKDKSLKMIEKFKEDNPNLDVKIFVNQKNKGLGFNYYDKAHKALGKYYMLVNGDAVDRPSEIRKIINNLGKADMILPHFIDKRNFLRRTISKLFVIMLNLITFNNLKYYNGQVLHLLDNVKKYGGGVSGFAYQAELVVALMLRKKTYIEVEIEPAFRLHGTTSAFTLRNIISVGKSIIAIFYNQMAYLIKKKFKKV
jgi:glycosyltransferase involved in cell wall biosynthesis